MQSQKRTPSHTTPVSKNQPSVPAKRAEVRTAPIVLDERALRHVVGGDVEGPKKYW